MHRALRYITVLVILGLIICLGTFVPVKAAGIITLSPASGMVGSSVTISGMGYNTDGETIDLYFDSTPLITGYPAKATTWNTTFFVPASTSGIHTITAEGSISGTTTTTFTVTPKITVIQNVTAVNMGGTGFADNENITISVDGDPVTYATASSIGSWKASIPSVAAGSHTFAATGNMGNSVSTIFNVVSYATIALSQANGPAATSVTVKGTGFASNETGITVTFDGNQVGTSTSAGSTGSWNLTFNIPLAAAGPHKIGAYGSITTISSIPTRTFTIIKGLTLNKSSAPPGTTITVTGSGFAADETGINVTLDGKPLGIPATASAIGDWITTFVVPEGTAGTHSVGAYGDDTAAGSIPVVTFSVRAGISLSKTSGGAGTSVKVNGAGFASGETGIMVTYDGKAVGPPIAASATGSWTTTFTIPPSPAGAHTIGASGSITSASSIPPATFTSTTSVTIPSNTTSGPVGSSLNLAGTGFAAGDAVTITYDGNHLGAATADNTGGWATIIIIPPSIAGSHTITVKGSAIGASNLGFKVTPSILADYSSGYVGSKVNVNGSGFAANSPLEFTFDDSPISNLRTVTTNASGSFTQVISIPVSRAGPHTIKVRDAQNNSSGTDFDINIAGLATPYPLSPPDGAKVGLTGSITPDLRWSPVTDPNGGVTYSLQIDSDPDFSHPLVAKSSLIVPHYTLSKFEALPHGIYYWRVRAVDAAFNQSAWSERVTLQSGILSATVLIIIIILVVAAVLAAIYLLLIRPLQRRKTEEMARAAARAPEILIFGAVEAGYRALGTENSAKKQRALPWRLALPQAIRPSKGVRALPPVNQAHLKLISDFVMSIHLIEPGNNTDWLVELAEIGSGQAASSALYNQLLNGGQIRYEPSWMRHPTFLDLQNLLEGQPILQELTSFVDMVNHSIPEAILLLQDIYRDITPEVSQDILPDHGWEFISGIYADALSWFLGKYLGEPSEKDYSIRPEDETEGKTVTFVLSGEQNIPFAGQLIKTPEESEAMRLRTLHLNLRRTYRNNERARAIAGYIAQLDIQKGRLLNAFSRFKLLNPVANSWSSVPPHHLDVDK